MSQYTGFVFDLTLNLALFITGAFIFGNMVPKIQSRPRTWRALLLGGIIGSLGILLYFLPAYLGVDNLINTQIVLLAAAMLFGGRSAGLVTFLMLSGNLILVDSPGLLFELMELSIPFLFLEGYLLIYDKPVIGLKQMLGTSVLLVVVNTLDLIFLQNLEYQSISAWLMIAFESIGIFVMAMMAFSIFDHELSRDRVETKLNDSVERYQVLVDNSPDIIFNCNAGGEVMTANRKFYQLLAAKKKPKDQITIYDVLIGERDRMEMRRLIADAIQKEKPIFREREFWSNRIKP